jgi:hypothetical protein
MSQKEDKPSTRSDTLSILFLVLAFATGDIVGFIFLAVLDAVVEFWKRVEEARENGEE